MAQNTATKAEMFRILNTLDVDAALKQAKFDGEPLPETREIALAGLHKARVRQPDMFSFEQRSESHSWLLEHGYKPY